MSESDSRSSGGVAEDRPGSVFACDRLVIRKLSLGPFATLRIFDEEGRCVASAGRRHPWREQVRIRGAGPGGPGLLKIARDNPRIELEPSFTIRDDRSGETLGRLEIREPEGFSEHRYWEIHDGRRAVIGLIADPMSWPQFPVVLRFGTRGTVTVRRVFSLVRPAYEVEIGLGRQEHGVRIMAVALAVLLAAIRKTVPPMPAVPLGPS